MDRPMEYPPAVKRLLAAADEINPAIDLQEYDGR